MTSVFIWVLDAQPSGETSKCSSLVYNYTKALQLCFKSPKELHVDSAQVWREFHQGNIS